MRFFFICLTALSLIFIGLLFALTDRDAVEKTAWAITYQDLVKAKRIIIGNISGNNKPGSLKTLYLTEKDLNVASNYLLKQYLDINAHAYLTVGQLRFAASIMLPSNPIGNYVNVDLVLHHEQNRPIIDKLSIGQINIPKQFARWALGQVIRRSVLADYSQLARTHIRELEARPRILKISYRWDPRALIEARRFLTEDADERLFIAYQKKLAALVNQWHTPRYITLDSLFQPLFILAKERSSQGNAVNENRALLIVLAAYINRQDLKPLIESDDFPSNLMRHAVVLNRRIDLAQHLTASAAMAASGRGQLANLIGVFKEIKDSYRGSGFSFVDLAADRTGTRFGNLAVESESDARDLQEIMSGTPNPRLYLPNLNGLPESLTAGVFRKRFGGIYSPRYRKLIAQIDQRIEACPLYVQ